MERLKVTIHIVRPIIISMHVLAGIATYRRTLKRTPSEAESRRKAIQSRQQRVSDDISDN